MCKLTDTKMLAPLVLNFEEAKKKEKKLDTDEVAPSKFGDCRSPSSLKKKKKMKRGKRGLVIKLS